MIYIIAIDSDGTLRKTDGTISDFTKMVIKKQIDKENIVVICTARPRYHTQKISNEVGANRFMISSKESSLAGTIRLAPKDFISKADDTPVTVACVLICKSISGKYFLT